MNEPGPVDNELCVTCGTTRRVPMLALGSEMIRWEPEHYVATGHPFKSARELTNGKRGETPDPTAGAKGSPPGSRGDTWSCEACHRVDEDVESGRLQIRSNITGVEMEMLLDQFANFVVQVDAYHHDVIHTLRTKVEDQNLTIRRLETAAYKPDVREALDWAKARAP